MAMVISELIPRCRRQGLGRLPQLTGIMGIWMGALADLPGRIAAGNDDPFYPVSSPRPRPAPR
jgi:hypothetical protein